MKGRPSFTQRAPNSFEQSIEPDAFPFGYHIAISNPYVMKHIYHSGLSDCILIKYIVDTLQSLALR